MFQVEEIVTPEEQARRAELKRLYAPDHEWVGTAWEPSPSIDCHQRAVTKYHPKAAPQYVARGVAWRAGGLIVAEIRRSRGGEWLWEGWLERR